jgi:hypothetical protein
MRVQDVCNSTVNNKNELNIVKIYDTSKTKLVIDKSKAFLLKKTIMIWLLKNNHLPFLID